MTSPAIAVFCGSSPGVRPDYAATAHTVGTLLARAGVTLVYGGGRLGLMGTLADAALAAGGRVIGVIPTFMVEKERAHTRVTELITVASMHDRKAVMADRAHAFLTLPGGVGTLDELFEAITWNQLGLQRKPIGVLSVQGYFEPLKDLLDAAELEGFLPVTTRDNITFSDDPASLINRLLALAAEG